MKKKENKTVIGLLWSFIDLISNQGIQFVIQIVLARLLLPEHFGLIGLVLVFISLANTLVDSGFKQALIRESKVGQVDYSTVFYFNLLLSTIIYLTLFFMAPLISDFFEDILLIKIIRILSLGIIINSLSLVPQAMLSREINFKSQTKVNFISSIISGVIGIILAFVGFEVWSLVFRTLTMNLIQTVLYLWIKSWLPSFVFSVESLKKLFGFGSKLLIAGLIDTIYQNIYYMIIGKQYTSKELGYYTNATRLSDFASRTLTLALQRVTYPALSSIKDETAKLKITYRKMIRHSAYVFFPIIAGLIAISKPLIALLFGNQWLPMIPYFQILAFASMLFPISAINLNVLKVLGKSDMFLYLEILKKIVFTFLIVLAVLLKTGIYGLLFAIVLNSIFSLLINTHFSGREINYPTKDQFKDIFPAYLLSIIMAITTLKLGTYLTLEKILIIIIQIIFGITFYILLSKVFKIKEFYSIYNSLIFNIKKYSNK